MNYNYDERTRLDRVCERLAALERRVGVLEGAVDAGATVPMLSRWPAGRRRVDGQFIEYAPAPPDILRYAPVDDHRRDKERPMMVCERAETCVQPHCQSRVPHPLRDNCKLSCCAMDDDGGRCIPVPASPEPAIPDVPTPVGTEAFQERLRGHIQELGGAYSWGAGHPVEWTDDYLERMADVACTLRDAYDLARTGDHEAAQEKLKEIEW